MPPTSNTPRGSGAWPAVVVIVAVLALSGWLATSCQSRCDANSTVESLRYLPGGTVEVACR